MTGRVLVLEFNELAPPLMDRFIVAGDLPNFERLRESSTTWITEAEVSEGEALNPWVQWVTVHTGLAASEHGAIRLGEPVELDAPSVAEAASAAGRSVWLCSPMNHPRPRTPLRGAFLPDPWCDWMPSQPTDLEVFHQFVSRHVQEHTNTEAAPSPRSAAQFVRFLAGHGLRASTAGSLLRQVLGERLHRRGRWQRAMELDRLQWDLFRWFRDRLHADYATFFSNSTAHAQHLYWRDMEPDRFQGHEADPRLSGAIRAGYRAMDRLVGRAVALCGDDTTLVLCTALSQQANLSGVMLDRACFYRPRSFTEFCERLSVVGLRGVVPVMAEEFHLAFESPEAAAAGAERLRGTTLDGMPAFAARCEGDLVFAGCTVFQPMEPGARFLLPSGERLPVEDLLYRADAPRSGTHHGDGLFWVHRPGQSGREVGGRVSLRAVAPTLLTLLGVDPPPGMAPPVIPHIGRRGA